MAEAVTLVISGKPYFSIHKHVLSEYSYYFRALLSGNFGDSFKSIYKFQGWSTSAFDILLEYIASGEINFKGKTTANLECALEISQYLCMDDFAPKLVDTLVTSWTLLDTKSAFKLAEKFKVKEKLVEYAAMSVKCANESNPKTRFFLDNINFDALCLVTALESFWEIKTPGLIELEPYDVLWTRLLEKHRTILQLALNSAPNLKKAKNVLSSFGLEYFNRENRGNLFNDLVTSSPSYACLRTALEERLFDINQNLRKLLSHIRIAFLFGYTPKKTLGVYEFNFNSWSWSVKEFHAQFDSELCDMHKDYSTFINDTGLYIIRMKNRFPKEVKINSDLFPAPFSQMEYNILHGKFLYIIYGYNFINETLPVPLVNLLKIDVFTFEASECSIIPLDRIQGMLGHGHLLYIVGYSDAHEDLYLYTYNIKTHSVSLIMHSNQFGSPIRAMSIIKWKVYILSRECYAVVDTKEIDDEKRLQVKAFMGIICDIWDYELLEVRSMPDCMLLLLRVFCGDMYYPDDFMVARLDLEAHELTPLGILPRITCICDFTNFHDNALCYQMETRSVKKRDVIMENEEILQRVRKFES